MENFDHCCAKMRAGVYDRRSGLFYCARFREYSIVCSSGAMQNVYFCPWCGSKLPESKRDEWYERIDDLGIDDLTDEVPIAMLSEEWMLSPSGLKK